MIRYFLKNDLSKRRWDSFKSQRLSLYSLIIFLIICFFSFTAEFWANSKPLYMSYEGKSYFPVLKTYHPKVFGIENTLRTDYRALAPQADRVLWPLIEWDPYESNKTVEEYPAPPSSDNILGTDNQGRDILTRLIYGCRSSLLFAFFVWILTLFIGVFLGGAMGYFGSWTDLIGQRLVEIFSTIPVLFILLILSSIFRPGLVMLALISAVFGWISWARYSRAEFLRLRKRSFAEAGRALGGSHMRIIWKHIFPNSLVPVITFSPFEIAGFVYALSALDYLGFGLPPPTPSWGELLSQAKEHVSYAWWLALYPSLALFFTLILLALLGNGIRVALDPKK